MGHRWFVPEVDDPADITEQERAFASALSEATADLVSRGGRDILIPAAVADHGYDAMVAGVCLKDWFDRHLSIEILNFGVLFNGERVVGGEMHPVLYFLTERRPGLSLDATGTVEQLAQHTAEWFAGVLRRPIVQYVWLRAGEPYAMRYAFADTSETLVSAHDRFALPQGPPEWLRALSRTRDGSWPQADTVPTPDLYTYIRGDMETAHIPAGVRCEANRVPGPWYR